MNLSATFLEVIDLRSFSSVWYWIVVTIAWSQMSYRPLGVPFDRIQRARRKGGEDMADVETLAAIQVRRTAKIVQEGGPWVAGGMAFVHTVMLTLGIWYGIELALAIELIMVPATLVGVMGMFTANRIFQEEATGPRLLRLLLRQRFWTQVIGMLSICVTAAVAMLHLFAYMMI
ncbi:MAG: component of SufBCD complex [Rubellimicrobium sp.]|nr:component of SufBCD complex [Rubellimicrobium sp.]